MKHFSFSFLSLLLSFLASAEVSSTPVCSSVGNPIITISVNIVNNTGSNVILDGDMSFVLGNPDHNGYELEWSGSFNKAERIRFSKSSVALAAGESKMFTDITWKNDEMGMGMGEKSPADKDQIEAAGCKKNVMVYVYNRSEVVLCDNMDPSIVFQEGGVYTIVLSSITIPEVGINFISGGLNYVIVNSQEASIVGSDTKYKGDITIPQTVTYNGKIYNGKTYIVKSISANAFSGCNELTSIIIPNSVSSIGENAFEGCSGLNSIVIENGNPKYDSRDNCNAIIETESNTLILGCKKTAIPNSVLSIGNSAFKNCIGLTSINIPNSVKHICSSAFYGCSSLTSVIIGSGVLSIDYGAFYGTNLTKTIWLTNTPPSGYENADGRVNYVSNDLFSFYNQVKYQFLSSYFDVDGIRYVPVSPSERTCDAIDCMYDESASNTKISSTVVYKGITMTVKNIQPYLTYNNNYIENLTVDNEGELAKYAFANCSNMKYATLGQKITAIGEYAFSGCKSLQTLIIPNLVTKINIFTFQNCESLSNITIHNAINKIDDYAFWGCTCLKNLIIDNRKTELSLGSNGSEPLFSFCPLDSVYIGGNISYNTSYDYGYSPFYRNTSLRAVNITDKETEISENEFYGCTNLQRVIIGDGVTSIGKWAFSGCSSLKYFAFGSKVATIGKEAFSDCTAVTELISRAATPPTCGSQALDDINKWECKLYVPTGTQTKYKNADQWKEFFFCEEGTGSATQDPETAVPAPLSQIIKIIDTIYNLSGQRYNKPRKGINIIDGKKIVVK